MKCGVWGLGLEVWGLGFVVWGVGCEEFGAQGLGFGVRDSVFRDGDLGLTVWGWDSYLPSTSKSR